MKRYLMKHYFLLLSGLAIITLTACGGDNKDVNAQLEPEQPAQQLYNKAQAAYDREEYVEAARLFDEVERQHPYSQLAVQSQLNAALSAYKNLRYDEAIIGFDRFVELHPGHEQVPYALYMKGLCYYEQISDVKRDQEMTKRALDSFSTVISRFPDSAWAREAQYKRDLTFDHLAGKEMEIGRYYLTRGHVNAAINRFLAVVKNFDTTTHTPEALHRLVESYMTLGLQAQALQVAAVLGYNYPGSEWYERSYSLLNPEQRKALMEDRGWFDRTVDSLLGPQ